VVYSFNHDITASFTLNSAPELPISDLALSQCSNSNKVMVLVHSHAHGHHEKVLELLIYVQYGCGKQSKVDYCLNHDITTSCTLDVASIIYTPRQ